MEDWRHGSRSGDSTGVDPRIVSALEDIEDGQFRKLAAENSWVASKVMNHDLRGLLIFSEISTLIEATRSRRIHEKVWRMIEFNDESSWS